jgi:signal transduction histidine kinase
MTYFLMHDIKNHLGCVLGYAKLLLGRDENATWSEGDRDAVAKINRQATRMAGAVRDVLDLALGTTFFFTIPNQQPATFGGKNGESTDV